MSSAQSMLMIVTCFLLVLCGLNIKASAAHTWNYGRRLSAADALDQTGFISIDCGANASYTDESTNIYYTTDAEFVETGKNREVAQEYQWTSWRQNNNVRSFPEGKRNCYTLKATHGKGSRYMIRAHFMYGNYDSQNKPPTFEIHLGTDVWANMMFQNAFWIEMVHTPPADSLQVCLVNIGLGIPFISALELRPLPLSFYGRNPASSLDLQKRRHIVATNSTNTIRYSDDVFHRLWKPMYLGPGIKAPGNFTTSSSIFALPFSVLEAATTSPIHLDTSTDDPNAEYWYYLHFAEYWNSDLNQTRELNITVNGDSSLLKLSYLDITTNYSTIPVIGSTLDIYIESTERSSLPPILNAYEVYTSRKLNQSSTYQDDGDAITKIKAWYGVTNNWQGDPCFPEAYIWDGVKCSENDSSSSAARITSLYLSSNELTGNIAPWFSNLTALQVLDLSNNNLSGEIPAFLADLPLLKTLNLTQNSFTGKVPQQLLERSAKGLISLSVEENPGLCLSSSCASKQKKRAFIVPVAACAGVVILLLVAGFIIVSILRKKGIIKSYAQKSRPKQRERKGGLARFTYSELEEMTTGFQKLLGKGGFAEVYYGRLNCGREVAVKILSPSVNASKEFGEEVELLMAIRHKNLVSLVGCCEEGTRFWFFELERETTDSY